MVHIRDRDLAQIQETTRTVIRVMRPDANAGMACLKIQITGSQEGRAAAHQAFESLVNNRALAAERPPAPPSAAERAAAERDVKHEPPVKERDQREYEERSSLARLASA
jgi:hypothetical protein